MTKLRLAMQSAAMVEPDPNLMRVADATLRLSDPNAYATALAAVYDVAKRTVRFASAGHPGPVLRTADGRIEAFSASGSMLGLHTGDETETCTLATPPGSTLVFYTFRRLAQALLCQDLIRGVHPAEALVDAVLSADKAQDDIALIVALFDAVDHRS